MNDVPKLFGSLVFNESVMKDRLRLQPIRHIRQQCWQALR